MVGYCTWPPLVNSAGRWGADGADGACKTPPQELLPAGLRPTRKPLNHGAVAAQHGCP